MKEDKRNIDNGQDKGSERILKHVKERVVERPHYLRKIIKKLLITIPLAIVFGVVSCIVFVYLRPQLEKRIGRRDEEITTTVEETTSKEEQITETEKVFTADDLKEMYSQLYEMGDRVKRSMVTIEAYDGEKEIFEDIEDEIISSGIIISIDAKVHILTMYENVANSENIKVTFNNGISGMCQLEIYDKVTGMAIITINTGELTVDTTNAIEVATLSAKATLSTSEPIMYIGNPFGLERYETIGFVSNQEIFNSGLDMAYRILRTDITLTECNNGFLFDMKGEVIGIVFEGVQVVEGIEVSDVKFIIDNIRDNKGIVHMGIYGEKITDEIRNISGINMPDGVYVTKVERDSPAYVAGVRKGDIITRIGSRQIYNMLDVKTCLQNSASGNKLVVDVKRQNNESFDGYTLEVILDER